MGDKITESLEYYDILAVVVPGALLIGAFTLLFPSAGAAITGGAQLPDAILLTVLVALTLFTGQMVQAVASLLERTLGERPSDSVFRPNGATYMAPGSPDRVGRKLQQYRGEASQARGLYELAAHLARFVPGGRVARFEGLYAFHRGMYAVFVLLFFAVTTSGFFGRIQKTSPAVGVWAAWEVAIILMVLLLRHRTRQRAEYLVREILLTAETYLDSQNMVSNRVGGKEKKDGE